MGALGEHVPQEDEPSLEWVYILLDGDPPRSQGLSARLYVVADLRHRFLQALRMVGSDILETIGAAFPT